MKYKISLEWKSEHKKKKKSIEFQDKQFSCDKEKKKKSLYLSTTYHFVYLSLFTP